MMKKYFDIFLDIIIAAAALVCLISFPSCHNQEATGISHYDDFPQEITVKSERIHLDSTYFRYPYRIKIKDSIVVIMDLHGVNYFFTAFTYPDWKPLGRFGKRGEGPEEMLSAEAFRFHSLDSLYTLDTNRSRLTRWSLSLEKQTIYREETILLDDKIITPLDFCLYNNLFLIPDYLGNCHFFEVNDRGALTGQQGEIPEKEDNNKAALAQAWRSFTDYNKINGIYAMATQLGEVIEIYDLNTGTHTTTCGPNGKPKFRVHKGNSIPIGIMGFGDIKVTDHYIYATFQGISFQEKLRSVQNGENPEDGGRFLYVFDLQGNPIKKYILDRPVYGFEIDEQTNTILTLSVEEDQPVAKFKM